MKINAITDKGYRKDWSIKRLKINLNCLNRETDRVYAIIENLRFIYEKSSSLSSFESLQLEA
jgi:hypothetical protein